MLSNRKYQYHSLCATTVHVRHSHLFSFILSASLIPLVWWFASFMHSCNVSHHGYLFHRVSLHYYMLFSLSSFFLLILSIYGRTLHICHHSIYYSSTPVLSVFLSLMITNFILMSHSHFVSYVSLNSVLIYLSPYSPLCILLCRTRIKQHFKCIIKPLGFCCLSRDR